MNHKVYCDLNICHKKIITINMFYTLTCIPIYCNCTFDYRIIRACNLILSKEMIIVLQVFQVSQNRRNMI